MEDYVQEPDITIPVRNGNTRSKIQLEHQQPMRKAEHDERSERIVYPGGSLLRAFYNAAAIEIVYCFLLAVFGMIAIIRIFFVKDADKTQADIIGLYLVYAFMYVCITEWISHHLRDD